MSEVKEEIKQSPDGTLEQGEFKIKKKPKKLTNKKQTTTKLDLSKKEVKYFQTHLRYPHKQELFLQK